MIPRRLLVSTLLLIVAVSISCAPLFSGPERGPLKIEPDSLPGAVVGAPYETEIRISQTETPVADFSILEGALPPGLELVRVEGQDVAKISGTPQEAGTFTFTVLVRCYSTSLGGQRGDVEYTIVVES